MTSWFKLRKRSLVNTINCALVSTFNSLLEISSLIQLEENYKDRMAAPAWNPYFQNLGHLPVTNVGAQQFPLTIDPKTVREIQVYAFVSIQNAPVNKDFHRGYYEIYTKRGDVKYTCYMNVAGVSDTIVNSDNVWLPYGEGFDRNLYVTFQGDSDLIPAGTTVKDSGIQSMQDIARRRTANNEKEIFAEVFVTGFKSR